jgi:predicted amidohydrolase
MRVNLVAVQARLDLEHYRSFEAFRGAMSDLVDDAVAACDNRFPSLLVFPEALGFFMSLGPYYYDLIRDATKVQSAIWRVGLRKWPQFLLTAARYRTAGLRTALLHRGLESREAYFETFSELARREGVYIAAGTGLFPDIMERPLKQARVAGREVYNVAPLFNPSGALLQQSKKVHRASRWERRFAFGEGTQEDLGSSLTSAGRIGVLVCHDSLRDGLLSRMDALGTQILAVPAYNMAPWHSLVRGTEITQEDAWLRRGLPQRVNGRENIQFAVCSMLVGSIFDVYSEGRSFICQNTVGSNRSGLVAVAASHTEQGVVAAQVELDQFFSSQASRHASYLALAGD